MSNVQQQHPWEFQNQMGMPMQQQQMQPMHPMGLGMPMQQMQPMHPMGLGMPMQQQMAPGLPQPAHNQQYQTSQASHSLDTLTEDIISGGSFFMPDDVHIIRKVLSDVSGDDKRKVRAIAALLVLGVFHNSSDNIVDAYLQEWGGSNPININVNRDMSPTGTVSLEQILALVKKLEEAEVTGGYTVYKPSTIPIPTHVEDLILLKEKVTINNRNEVTAMLSETSDDTLKLIGLAAILDKIPGQIAGVIRPMVRVLEDVLKVRTKDMYRQVGLSGVKLKADSPILAMGISTMFSKDEGTTTFSVTRILPNVRIPALTKGKTYKGFFKTPPSDGIYYLEDKVLVVNGSDATVF